MHGRRVRKDFCAPLARRHPREVKKKQARRRGALKFGMASRMIVPRIRVIRYPDVPIVNQPDTPIIEYPGILVIKYPIKYLDSSIIRYPDVSIVKYPGTPMIESR